MVDQCLVGQRLNSHLGCTAVAIFIALSNLPASACENVAVMWPEGLDQDVKRWDDARKSPISALLDGIKIPQDGGPITSPPSEHPFDGFKRGTKFENFHQNVKSYNLLMHHVCQAVVYINNPSRQQERINDIEWFLDRIREDLSSIAFYGDGETQEK